MALLDDIGSHLQTSGLGTLASTIFLGYMPDSPDVVISVYESRGTAPQLTFGPSAVALERPFIRVMCRAARNDYPASRTKAMSVLNCLGVVRNQTIGSTKFLSINSTTSPYPVRVDDKERAMFGVDFAVWLAP